MDLICMYLMFTITSCAYWSLKYLLRGNGYSDSLPAITAVSVFIEKVIYIIQLQASYKTCDLQIFSSTLCFIFSYPPTHASFF